MPGLISELQYQCQWQWQWQGSIIWQFDVESDSVIETEREKGEEAEIVGKDDQWGREVKKEAVIGINWHKNK